MRETAALALATLVAAALGCSIPHFAPPARLAAGTMPEQVAAGTATARITGNTWYGSPVGGELRGEYGINDELTLDAGLATIIPNEFTSLLGSGGLRFKAIDHEWLRVALSVAFGLGAGGGGLGDAWDEHFAISTALGLDVGVRFHDLFGLFVANRYQISTAEGAPTTHWGLHVIGAQLDIDPLFFVLEGGPIYLARAGSGDDDDGLLGPWPWFGLTIGVRFALPDLADGPEPLPDAIAAVDAGR